MNNNDITFVFLTAIIVIEVLSWYPCMILIFKCITKVAHKKSNQLGTSTTTFLVFQNTNDIVVLQYP